MWVYDIYILISGRKKSKKMYIETKCSFDKIKLNSIF
jgi:hypothetical protein